MDPRYQTDFYSWAMAQSELARTRSSNALDWDHVAEELRLLGVSEERELKSRLIVLLAHLLKWAYQPQLRSRSWTNTIGSQRLALADHMISNPGLKPKVHEAFLSAYIRARLEASSETDLDLSTFPIDPPFTYEQAVDENWVPEAQPL
jgi:Domain of unknown function DUF29